MKLLELLASLYLFFVRIISPNNAPLTNSQKPSEYESSILKPLKQEPYTEDTIETLIVEYENPIPIVNNITSSIAMYQFPQIYTYDKELHNTQNLGYIDNNFGMRMYVDPFLTAARGNVPTTNKNDEERMINSNFVQYRSYKDNKISDENWRFQITFVKEICYPEKTLDQVISKHILTTRANKGWGEKEDFYPVARIKFSNERWKNGQIITWVLDDNGVVDDTSKYIIDYALEDQYGNKFVNTIRGYRGPLDEEYEKISEMVGLFDSYKDYYYYGRNQCSPFESAEHFTKRRDQEITKIRAACKKNNFKSCPE